MKRWVALGGVCMIGVAAIAVCERRKVDVPASPAALLYLVADTEQELTRMPVRFARMSDQEEIRIGDEIAKSYAATQDRQPDPEIAQIQAYIAETGSHLAAHAHRRLPYKFHYLPDASLVNAFALPGGHVYIGAGLLALMDSEDELAAVLGHEIEHVDHYHCAERAQQQEALDKIPLADLFALPVDIFQAGYSKDQELEADREGTRLAVQAGYSANGAIRMFETFQRLYDESHARARTPQDEMSQVATDALEGYFRSHPLSSERIAQVNQLVASENWAARPERDLAVAYFFLTTRAENAFEAGRFAQAQQFAARSLKMHPDQERALKVQAKAQFAQADFHGAADSYRRLLEQHAWTIEIADYYALSLAAANRQGATGEFRKWMASASGNTRELRVPLGGLLLLAGDAATARQLRAEIRANPEDVFGPGELSDLGWWYYLAGDYSTAADLLNEAVQQRPGNAVMLVRLGWADIELRRLSDALQAINSASQGPGEQTMARAVTQWQAQERDTALREFGVATTAHAEWENPRWVGALYSPLVARSIQEMQAERERRKKAQITARR
ncbi:MAG TPA: M48 family metalloprotease [Candidatus Acidoferrales bacterium]|nr:M48 family metalloprotease [Candidatus Acidoferrales bacterium]